MSFCGTGLFRKELHSRISASPSWLTSSRICSLIWLEVREMLDGESGTFFTVTRLLRLSFWSERYLKGSE